LASSNPDSLEVVPAESSRSRGDLALNAGLGCFQDFDAAARRAHADGVTALANEGATRESG
jgi:hypothetical protein